MTIDSKTEGTRATRDELPAVIRNYLAAHTARDTATAIAAFADDAVVTDEGHTYRGRADIVAWLGSAGSGYTFTTEFRGATVSGAAHVDVVQHLEGDFPGGVADLHFRFTLDGAFITRLAIEP